VGVVRFTKDVKSQFFYKNRRERAKADFKKNKPVLHFSVFVPSLLVNMH
jgi:hypothetical protein